MAKGDRWSDDQDVEVREMRNADTVLGVIRERGRWPFIASGRNGIRSGHRTTGELLEIERLTSSSERGRRKSAAR